MTLEALGGGRWARRGKWLEVTPGKILTGAEDKDAAVDRWLLETVGMPEKLLLRLRKEGGIAMQGDRLRIALFPERETGIEPVWEPLEVLYEDDFCLVVHKPAGVAVHPDGSGGAVTLDHLVAAHYTSSGEATAVRHVHRLDKDTTGPVLYAKNEFAQLVLDEAMRAKAISRLYAAVVQGKVLPSLKVIDLPIGKDRHHSARRRVSPGGQPAVTRIISCEVWERASLLHVMLETGRTHQIRVHLSHMGHPLLGDPLYGESTPKLKVEHFNRQALHGVSLAFRHPWSGEQLEIQDPLPEDMVTLCNQYRASGESHL